MAEKEGCDAVVLGCTELPLIIDNENSSIPVLDSTRILARAAVKSRGIKTIILCEQGCVSARTFQKLLFISVF